MSDKTKIEWADATWNPVTGCTRVSPGCENCYIDWAPPFRIEGRHFTVPCEHCGGTGFEPMTGKFRDSHACSICKGEGEARSHAIGSTTGVRLHPERLDQPLRWKRPRKVFVNSLSDLFHVDVPDEYIARVWAVMALAPQHTFQVLTKRHGRMKALLNSDTFQRQVGDAIHGFVATGKPDRAWYASWPLPNVWLGVTVEDQQHADLRIPALLVTPAAVRFLSCEPLLGPVVISSALQTVRSDGQPCTGIDWVIAGGESGRDARPMHPDWARALRDQCQNAGVPFLFKQWGEWVPVSQGRHAPASTVGLTGSTPRGGHRVAFFDRAGVERDTNELSTFRVPVEWAHLALAGKKAAGRELDGRTWDEYPTRSPAGPSTTASAPAPQRRRVGEVR